MENARRRPVQATAVLLCLILALAGPLPAGAQAGQDTTTGAAVAEWMDVPVPEPSAPGEAWTTAPGHRAEVIEERTESSKTFETDQPGQFVTEVYADPIHHEVDGDLVDIDPELVDQGDGFGSEGTSTDVTIGVDGGSTEVTLDVGGDGSGGGEVSFGLPSARITREGGAEVGLENVAPGVDAELEVIPQGVKETLVLESAEAARNLSTIMDLGGLEPRPTDTGSIDLLDDGGAVAARIPPAWMADSRSHPDTGQPATSFGVSYGLEALPDGTHRLSLDLDDAWLDAPERVFPVVVDPSVLQADGGLDDTFVTAYTSADRSNLNHLQVGNNGYLGTRSFVHFPGLDALVGGQVHVAQLKLYQNGAGSCTPTPLDVFQVSAAWTGPTTTTWGGPPVASPSIGAADSAHGASGCAADWVEVDVTSAVASVADGTTPNHGFGLRARDEFATANFKQFASSETWAPPHVQVIWSQPSTEAPALPTDIAPAEPVATLTPQLSATYLDPQNDPGRNAFVLYDDDGQIVASGEGTPVNSGEISTFQVEPGLLTPGGSYRIAVFSLDDGDHASASVTDTTFSVSDPAFAGLSPGGLLFGEEQIELVFGGPTTDVTSVELGLDAATTIGTDSTAPYVFTWDTSTVADGLHYIAARANRASGPPLVSAVLAVEVVNGKTTAERLTLDYERGELTADQYAVEGVKAMLGNPATPARYADAPAGPGTEDLLKIVTRVDDQLSTAARQQVEDLLTPQHSTVPPVGRQQSCVDLIEIGGQSYGPLCRSTFTFTGFPQLDLFYTTLGPGASTQADVEDMADEIYGASQVYIDMGYELPDYIWDEGVTALVGPFPLGFANPVFRDGTPFPHLILIPAGDIAVGRHEIFHVFQYNYMATLDVTIGECPRLLCRETGVWWMEATANWADHQAIVETGTTEEVETFLSDFDDFAFNAPLTLTYHSLFGPVQQTSRAYGAFAFVEYLEQEFGQGAILDVFEYIDDDAPLFGEELTAIRAVETVLEDRSTTFEQFLPQFWASTYLLSGDTRAAPFRLDDADVPSWRQHLEAVSDAAPTNPTTPDAYALLGGDGFSSLARMRRVLPPIALVTNTPRTAGGPIGFGGAAVIDFTNSYSGTGDVEVQFQVADPRAEKVALMAISYDDDYPHVCAVEGPVFATGQIAQLSVRQAGGCDTMSVLMVQIDPNSTHSPGIDNVKLRLTFVPDDI